MADELVQSSTMKGFAVDGELTKAVGGLTKRELFAAMAMQGYIASGKYLALEEEGKPFLTTQHFADRGVRLADALIAELDKQHEPQSGAI